MECEVHEHVDGAGYGGGGCGRYLPQLPWENKASWEMKSFQHVWVLPVPAGMPRPHS